MGRAERGVLSGLAGLLLVGCGSLLTPVSPSPTGPAVHVVNLTGNAAIVGSSLLDDGAQHIVRACGGTRSVPAHELITDDGRLLVRLLMDDTGALDVAVDQWPGDPDEMDGHFSVGQIWSRGDIPPAELPKWITIRPEGVEISSAEPPINPPPTCAPWTWP